MPLSWTLSPHQPPKIAWLYDSTHPAGRYRFRLPEYWALHLYGYAAELTLDGEPHAVRDGAMTLQRPGVVSQYHWAKPSRHLAAHFQLPLVANHPAYRLPALLEPKQVHAGHRALLRRAVAAWPHQPARATAALWELLWALVEAHGQPVEATTHPAVDRATRFIEQHLAEPVSITDVVEATELSHNHLIRLFRAAYGMTIVEYLRRRRVDKAHHLLVGSTLPIKAVAVECGTPDLQAFNKMIRRALGASPSAVRAGDAAK